MIKCGTVELQITPPLGLSIPGYFEDRRSVGIKDELYVKALVLDDGNTVVAIIVIDAVAIHQQDVIAIRERVRSQTGILWENIMVSATHIHTGPPVASTFKCIRDEEYVSILIKKSADAAVIAFKKMKPVKIGFNVGREESISFNRRFFMKDGSVRTNPGVNNPLIDKPTGPIDPDVCVMRIDDEQGKPQAFVTNFACHPDVVGGNEYSGDYPGELSNTLKKVYGQDIVSLFITGTCGNINHIDVTNKTFIGQDYYIKMGRVLAGEVIKTIEKIETSDNIKIKASLTCFKASTRELSEEMIKKAEDLMKLENADPIEKIFAEEIFVYLKKREKTLDVEVQAIKVGDLAIVGLPGEIFVEWGLKLKKSSPFKFNMLNTLANARCGYLPTLEAFSQGGYEPKTTRINQLVPEAVITMVNTVEELLLHIYEGK